MSKFFDDTMQGLLEAIGIEKWNMPLTERKGMSTPTLYVSDNEIELINSLVEIEKKNVLQSELAKMVGSNLKKFGN